MMNPADQMHALRSGCGVLAPPRAFVAVAGPDAESLLQNLLTQDLAGMVEGEARRALLLTPKARIVSDARVIRILAEYLQPLANFRREKVRDTVVFFGSARIDENGALGRYYRDARELARLVTE